MHKRLTEVAVLTAVACCLATTAMATIYEVPVSGNLNGNSFNATLDLNVTDGQATSGSGKFTGFGLNNADLVLITTNTPGNEGGDGDLIPWDFAQTMAPTIMEPTRTIPPTASGSFSM